MTRMTLRAFAQASKEHLNMEDTDLSRAVEVASLLSDALLTQSDVGSARLMPGAGLCLENGYLYPTVMVDTNVLGIPPYDGPSLIPLREFYAVEDTLKSLLGGFSEKLDPNTMRALPISQGTLHAAPGSDLMGNMKGCVGPHVSWGAGRTGFLTAGHVAPTVGATVTDQMSAPLGTVLWSHTPVPALNKPPADLDAALVELSPAQPPLAGQVSRVVGAGDIVTIRSNGTQIGIFGFWGHLRFGSASTCYADCYATDQKVTAQGDSGGLVECAGDVVGMVVGSFTRRDMTIIQSIDYQISEIRRRSNFMISL
jgi:hypothetical protein